MALPKKWLKEQLQDAGCDEAKIDALVATILDRHTSTIDTIRESYGDVDSVKTELDNLKNKIERYGDPETVKNEFDKFKKTVETEKANVGKDKAVRALLEKAGVARAEFRDLLMHQIDLNSINLDGDNVKDAEKLTSDLKSKFAGCFAETSTQNTGVLNPPSGAAGGTGKTKSEILAIKDTTERQQAIAANHQLFGF